MADLQLLATTTTSDLQSLWSDLGVAEAETHELAAALADSVRAAFASAVEAQRARKARAEADIAGLQATVASLQRSMEEPVDVVSRPGRDAGRKQAQ